MRPRAVRLLVGVFLGCAVMWAIASVVRAQETGETLFKSKCAMCHGPDASGKTPMGQTLKVPDLRSDIVQKKNNAELKATITKGKNKMPAYEAKLSGEQIDQLVAYIREIAKH